MYLKSIEVQGFKSFANKITFQFHNGITGIVGPNGSGKSNVADAVRWVLGEQRIKQLRGASMQDVIFSGTEMRKPLSYAYVAITLDNADHQLAIDYDEVTVARRIYRSGESEYSINGTLCRLKDVNELFYDTGIGKEGYSIIGQGQIDKILSGKPEERRELFDEAAGIVKFKRRKNTAQKKLEDEKQNLVRVNDILAELEKQIGPLEKQSEKAKIYLKKKEDLKRLDVNLFLTENAHIREQLTGVSEKYKIAEESLAETTEKYERTKEEYEQIQGQLEMLEQEIETARQTLTDTSVMRGKLEGQVNVLKEQIHSAQGNEGHLRGRKETVEEEISAKENDKSVILEDKRLTDEKAEQTRLESEEARALLGEIQEKIASYNARIETGKNTIISALNERAAIRSRMGRFDTMLEQVNIRRSELNSRLLRAKSDEAEQKEAIQRLREAFEAVNETIRGLNEKQKTLEERIAAIKPELTEKDQKLRQTQALYQQEKSKLETLSNLAERYEGYGGSVKRVMEQKGHEKGIVGVVADIIKVEKKYEIAIETALGGNIQNIVTEDEETAKHMIAFLKQTKGGRATFLPLTSITNPQEFKTPEALSEQGVIGLADSLVQIDKKYANVAKAMVGRIMVVDTVDHAVKIARKYDYGIRMVTLEGELLVPGGAISGGAFKNNSNLLGRRREIAELEEKVKKYQLQAQEIQKEIEKTKEERNKLRTELETARLTLQNKFIEQNTARLNVIAAEEKWNETEEGYGSLQEEQTQIEEQIRQIGEDKEKTIKELESSQSLEKQTEEEIRELQTALETYRVEETAQTARVSEQDVEAEKYRQQQEFKQENVNRIDGELLRLREELKEIEDALAQNAGDIERKQADISEIEQTIVTSHTAQSETETKLQENIARKEELGNQQKNFFRVREELSEQKSGLDKEVYRLNAQREKLEGALESQINYMWDEYEITLTDAASLRDETLTDLPEMKREISSLKDQIRKLGDVNVNAIEDYKNLMERYGFLKGQHDDLVEAEQTLLGIIQELDTAMRKQFQEKFGQICREFDKVFKELFGGGKGTLELQEEEDILEAGIRIIAQPPGKKLQNMMQLSGGEKALTAIALLFAIQNLKPSPFCLLDEIEAALDENNVGRFAKYLHKLTKNTQFIVITHRRGTMEKADRLYGITMQEKGISTLVSVNLIDSELDA
jgi:chromosome segregation protein